MAQMTINITSGNQVEGQKLDEHLQAQLFGTTASDAEKVVGMNGDLRRWMALVLSTKNNWSLANAEQYVTDHTTTVS